MTACKVASTQLLLPTGSAMCRFVLCSSLLRHGGAGVARLADDAALPGQQGVPVALPLREGSSGGSYGTAAEGSVPCPAAPLVVDVITAAEPTLWS